MNLLGLIPSFCSGSGHINILILGYLEMKLHEIQDSNVEAAREWIRHYTIYNPSVIDSLLTNHYYDSNNVLKVSSFSVHGTGRDFSPPPFMLIVEGTGKLYLSDMDIENIDMSWLTQADAVTAACAGYEERIGDALKFVDKLSHVRKLEQVFVTSDYDKISNVVTALSVSNLHTLAFSIQGRGDEQIIVRKLFDHLQVWHGNKSMHPSDRSFGYDVNMAYVDEFELQDWLVNLGYSELI
ncbi:hypothetical protein RsoM2USA_185 [Ralstonia phage RsoM2USA]|nr:hypothetical protein RsoM2USA_185 [Ralstonia phage RsoM2USA]